MTTYKSIDMLQAYLNAQYVQEEKGVQEGVCFVLFNPSFYSFVFCFLSKLINEMSKSCRCTDCQSD